MKLTEANAEIRAQNVTASEVGALMPAGHEYRTRSDVWMRLMGLSEPAPMTEPMRIGQALEPVLLELAQERLGRPLRANSRTYRHRRINLCATPDAFVLGAPELVELKATAGNWRFANGIPPDIEWQVRAQMACTHRQRVYVCVLIGLRLHVFTVERHRGKERALTQAVEAFWRDHIETHTPPENIQPRLELAI